MPEKQRNGHLAEAVVETIAQPLLVLDANLKVKMANRAFLQHFQVPPEETIGRQIYDLGNRQWNIPELRRLLEDVLRQSGNIEDYRVEHSFETIGDRIMSLNVRRLTREGQPRPCSVPQARPDARSMRGGISRPRASRTGQMISVSGNAMPRHCVC